MTNEINTGGPAFPHVADVIHMDGNTAVVKNYTQGGMTLRQYAAIKLKVPNSGTDWLDEMIRESIRDDFAAKAMQGMLAENGGGAVTNDKLADWAYQIADAMLKAREQS